MNDEHDIWYYITRALVKYRQARERGEEENPKQILESVRCGNGD